MCEMLWNDPMDMPGMVPNKVRWTVQLQLTHFPRNCGQRAGRVTPSACLPAGAARPLACCGCPAAYMKAAQLPHPCLLPTVPPALCSAAWAWRLAPMSQSGGWRPTAYRWWCAATRCACPCSGQLIGWGCAADGRHLVGSALTYNMTRRRELVVWLLPPLRRSRRRALERCPPHHHPAVLLLSCTPILLLPRRSRRRALRWLMMATPSPCSAHPTTATRWCA